MSRSPAEIVDEWLVIEAKRGREPAMRALARRWQPKVVGHAFRRTGDPEAAAEVAQETWVAVVRGLPRLEDPAAFRGWILRIVDHKAADWIRRRRSDRDHERLLRERASPEAAEEPRLGELEAREPVDLLRAALRRMPDDARALLAMFHVDGLSVIEIAQTLEIPVGTVKSRLHHARRRLREIFETLS